MIQPLFIGTTELLLITGVALLLFGGKKLPEMMRGLGKGVQEFKKGMNDVGEKPNTDRSDTAENSGNAEGSENTDTATADNKELPNPTNA
ncbi:MAG: twin-arginine translocase TatA/TatE family subunit [Alloprevotella sp.]|nr:twin-arginine translocase TatA/TatE family subunit [Alloprevotella sp.]